MRILQPYNLETRQTPTLVFPMYIYNPTVINVAPLDFLPPFSHFLELLNPFFLIDILFKPIFYILCSSTLSLPYPTLTPFNSPPLPLGLFPLCYKPLILFPSLQARSHLLYQCFIIPRNFQLLLNSQISIDLHPHLPSIRILSHTPILTDLCKDHFFPLFLRP